MTTAERLAALEAEVTKLRREVGQFETRQDTSKRPEELPNGDYNVAFRQRQIGEAIDDVVLKVAALGSGAAQGAKGDTGATGPRGPQGIPGVAGGGSGGDCPLVGPTPPAFQWPVESNGFAAPAGSGGPSGPTLEKNIHHGGFLCVSNAAPEGSNATSGPNGQAMGIEGRSKGRIRVNTRGGAESDGGMRDMTNYVDLEPRDGAGTITRRGYDIYCSEPDAITIRTALWTRDPGGTVDGGVYILRRVSPVHFIGNWSDPALDYESRPYFITGGDQPDRDRFSTKAGIDSNAVYGWRVDKPMNSTEAHPSYEEGGYSDKGDFLLRLKHDNGSQDVGRYSKFVTFNEGRGIAFGTSDGRYASCPDAFIIQPGKDGQPGRVDLCIDGAVRVLETYPMPDGRVGVCFTPFQ